jgi:energy-coupling factor transport system ATP-binding protein
MRKRVEETLDLLGLADLRNEPLHQLSGGEQQRVAIGSVLTTHPRVLVLDEPTSALDPTAAEDVLATITRLVHDLAVTVVVAEHRLERVVQYADRIVALAPDGTVTAGSPAPMMVTSVVAPPVVELGRLAGWDPLPLSIRDARRRAAPLRARLDPLPPAGLPAPGPPALRARGILVTYGDLVAVRDVDLDLAGGQVTALMGRNGSGKSSLLWALQGSGRRQRGSVQVEGRDPHALNSAQARALVGLVPQTPSDLLYLPRVDAELAQADRDAGGPVGAGAARTGRDPGSPVGADRAGAGGPSARQLLDRLLPGIPGDRHPRDLSEGQRLLLALAVQLRAAPRIVLLDEPTRGLDYEAKHHLRAAVADLAASGHSIVISTHDVEFAAQVADRVLVMAEGEIVADGPCREVVASSPAFAPQVAKIFAPLGYLTVADVAAALDPAPVTP